MKNGITRKILLEIGRSAISAKDLVAAILSEGYGASISRIERSAARRAARRISGQEATVARHRFSSMLCKLKKEGLILEKNNLLHLTIKGDLKLVNFGEKEKFSAKKYKTEPTSNFLIVAYDIPGKNHKKRLWLRESLSNMGLRRIQQSVWMGKVKLPKDFLDDLKGMAILNYVEIFEITKTGTLREI